MKAEGFQYVFRECKRGWLEAYLTWYLSKEDPILRQENIEKDSVCSGIWLMISQDKEAFFNEIGIAVDEKPFFKADSIYGYVIGNCGSNVFDKK